MDDYIPPQGTAEGELYVDDGHSFNYKKGEFLRRSFRYQNNQLSSALVPNNTNTHIHTRSMQKRYCHTSACIKLLTYSFPPPPDCTFELCGQQCRGESHHLGFAQTATKGHAQATRSDPLSALSLSLCVCVCVWYQLSNDDCFPTFIHWLAALFVCGGGGGMYL